MKKCPYCAEEVLDEAIKCKHCGGDLPKVVKESEFKRILREAKEKQELEKKEKKPRKPLSWKWIFPIIAIFLAISAIREMNYEPCKGLTGEEKASCRANIDASLVPQSVPSSNNISTNVAEPKLDCYSGWNGAHKEGEKVLKQLLKDPSSYEYTNTIVGGKFVKILFVAKNSFGAKGSGEFTFTTDDNCSVLDYKISNY